MFYLGFTILVVMLDQRIGIDGWVSANVDLSLISFLHRIFLSFISLNFMDNLGKLTLIYLFFFLLFNIINEFDHEK